MVWTEANQFWLPNFYVWNARELVRRSNKYEIEDELNNPWAWQDGYLNEQDRAGTAGNRYLYYDPVYGVFELFTMSHAKIKCDMDFSLYPFDTQVRLDVKKIFEASRTRLDITDMPVQDEFCYKFELPGTCICFRLCLIKQY